MPVVVCRVVGRRGEQVNMVHSSATQGGSRYLIGRKLTPNYLIGRKLTPRILWTGNWLSAKLRESHGQGADVP